MAEKIVKPDQQAADDDQQSPEELFNQLMAEQDALIPPGFAQQVERDLTGNSKIAMTRRLALAYLSTPFKESTEKLAADRELAVAVAHVSDVLKDHAKSYETLLGWIKAAHARMAVSIAIREDMAEILAEAKADSERVRDELHEARFLRGLKKPRK
jgi:hypothetical protein